MTDQAPSIGRIVHYRSYGTPGGEFTPECRAAIVTEVDPSDTSLIGLTAVNPTGFFFHSLAAGGCRMDDPLSPKGGTWHWPERV